MSFNIAIDGPAGAGKSTVAKRAAKELGFVYVDTGAMYRTIALALKEGGVNIDDPKALQAALDQIDISICYQDGVQHMILNGEDVSGLIRTNEISDYASKSSAIPAVRQKLLDMQRDMAKKMNLLMDGRDIGTKILPDADLKIYLTASVDVRAERRYLEMKEKGEACSFDEIRKEIEDRDYRDMHRAAAPLKMADDAVLLDSSDMDPDQVVAKIVSLAKERMNG